MANGIMNVKYIDDNKARNMKGSTTHIWEDVKDFYFLDNGINLLKIEFNGQGRSIVYIPMSNVAMVEYFKSKEDFERVYPRRR